MNERDGKLTTHKAQIEQEFYERGYPIHLNCDTWLSDETADALRRLVDAAIKHVENKSPAAPPAED
jgi:hypothetical protein